MKRLSKKEVELNYRLRIDSESSHPMSEENKKVAEERHQKVLAHRKARLAKMERSNI